MTRQATDRDEETVIRFEEGVIGVPRARRFELMERQGTPLCVLRCLDIEGFDLPVVDPRRADPDYRPQLNKRVSQIVALQPDDPVLLLAVTALEPGGGAVANLKAPVVVNVARRTAVQVILEGDYPLRAPVRLEDEPA